MSFKRIVFDENVRTINFSSINNSQPIFAQKGEKLEGMLVKESEGWILRIGGSGGASGHYPALKECIEDSQINFGYEFYVNA